MTLDATFQTTAQLYRAYMPFIKSGGLFIETHDLLPLGTETELKLLLPDHHLATLLPVKVVWVNPVGASGGRAVGVGVKFATGNDEQKHQIENILSSELASGHLTSTM